MSRLRVGVVTHSDLFAVGILSILSSAGHFEVMRVSGSISSIRQYLPLHAIVVDSGAMGRVNLGRLLFRPELPEIRVLCVELDANRAVVYDRGTAEFSQAGDVVALLLANTAPASSAESPGREEVEKP